MAEQPPAYLSSLRREGGAHSTPEAATRTQEEYDQKRSGQSER
jgi:hypothetical protein